MRQRQRSIATQKEKKEIKQLNMRNVHTRPSTPKPKSKSKSKQLKTNTRQPVSNKYETIKEKKRGKYTAHRVLITL